MGVPLTIDDLTFARALWNAYEKNKDYYNKWPKIKAAVETECRQYNLDVETYPSLYYRMRVRYGLIEPGPSYANVKRRDISELFPEGLPAGLKDSEAAEASPAPDAEKPGPRIVKAFDTKGELKNLLSKRRSIAELEKELSIPRRVLLAYIDEIREEGYGVSILNDEAWIERAAVLSKNEHFEKWDGSSLIRFGSVADTHLCNKFQQLTHLKTFYKLCEDREISRVYHSGDISDGFYHNRPEHVYELFRRGVDEQAEYIIEEYPKINGIESLFIEGNHDFTHQRNGGASIGRIIGAARKDLKFLGYGKARVWLTPKCPLDLVHPLDGKAYALSYRLQKNIDALQGGSKPAMQFFGHYHTYCNIFYRNIHAYMLPGFQAQNPWATLKSLMTQVGGIIFEVRVADDGEILSVTQELIPFYLMKENDY